MDYKFRKAEWQELEPIWEIIRLAIVRRKEEGSNQWQDGYPNRDVLQKDIERGIGFVLTEGNVIVGYAAVLVNDEPVYAGIDGKWLTNGDFVVVHRVAVSADFVGKGLAQKILSFVEEYAVRIGIYSIKADTNFDNIAMMKTFDKKGYVYCGEVYFRGSPRRAYEKVLHR